MISEEEEAFLLHYGVKGMRWGVRKRDDSSGTRTSRRQRRAEKKYAKKEARAKEKAAKDKFYQDKANRVLQTAMSSNKSLIKVMDAQGTTSIVTGEEFVNYATRGGVFNVKWTDVYAAQQGGKGPMVLNDNINARYKKSN